ncbi:hypothetical protein BJ878DRAFT_177516 [Calycina marina]|uniref:Uncharacterized protein n=1 Tax=Calycina marina TaxID=1763456 RepID=A0A9P7Z8P1_9HELO|nr:hypothetical protein BJ878DRAFT_177516 [Calycina marina]
MTGSFSEKDPERCAHYAGFMSHLNLTEANLIFWLLFLVVLILMCISSIQHHRSMALDAAKPPSCPESQSRRHNRKARKLRLRHLGIVGLCLILSVTCTIFEVYAAFNIEYCDGEDLMQLYWGFWSVLQVGSNIAIFGVMLQLWIVLGNVKSPSWAVALGTPVLVFAALGWIFREIAKVLLKRLFNKILPEDDSDVSEDSDEAEDCEQGVAGSNPNAEKWVFRS